MRSGAVLISLSAVFGLLGASNAADRSASAKTWWIAPDRVPTRCDQDARDPYWETEQEKAERLKDQERCRLVESFRSFVVERQKCTKPDDCSVVDTYCPFGCGVPVSKVHAAEVASTHVVHYKKVDYPCRYRCQLVTRATCVEGWCVATRGRPDGWRGRPPNPR